MAATLLNCPLRTASPHGVGGGVARVEARDQDVCKQEEPGAAGVVFVEAAEDTGRKQFAERRARLVDGLMEAFVGARAQELDPVGDKTVDSTTSRVSMALEIQGRTGTRSGAVLTDGGIFRVVKPVNERPHELAVHMGSSELIERVRVV